MAKSTKRKAIRTRGNDLKKTVRRGRKLNLAVNNVKATKKRRKSRSRRASRKVRKSLNQSGGTYTEDELINEIKRIGGGGKPVEVDIDSLSIDHNKEILGDAVDVARNKIDLKKIILLKQKGDGVGHADTTVQCIKELGAELDLMTEFDLKYKETSPGSKSEHNFIFGLFRYESDTLILSILIPIRNNESDTVEYEYRHIRDFDRQLDQHELSAEIAKGIKGRLSGNKAPIVCPDPSARGRVPVESDYEVPVRTKLGKKVPFSPGGLGGI